MTAKFKMLSLLELSLVTFCEEVQLFHYPGWVFHLVVAGQHFQLSGFSCNQD